MRRARPPSASPSGRSTRPPAIARPARQSPRKTEAAATRSTGVSISSSMMPSWKRSRSRAPTRSRSTALCRAPKWTSASSRPPITSPRASRSDRRRLRSFVRPCAAGGWWRSGGLVLFKRERVIALEPYDKGLLATTLRYPYEVRKAEDYFCDLPDLALAPDMLTLAEHIVDSKTGEFDPLTFRDRYEEALLAHLKAKQAGAVPERKPTFAAPRRVINLMEALRRSVAEDKKLAAPRKAAPAAPARKRA